MCVCMLVYVTYKDKVKSMNAIVLPDASIFGIIEMM